MSPKYIVFQDNLKGLQEKPQLAADTLADTIELIQNGRESQLWMYFIYTLHQENIPLYGTRFTCYKYVKAIAGSKVEPIFASNKRGLEYALTHNVSMAWLFTDDVYGDWT